jgi:DNA-binding NtrC family response regulator
MAQILVVEDDQPFAEALASVLRLEGHDVCVTYTADDGVEHGIARCPDVVVADWVLGGDLHGGEVCDLIQSACPSVKSIVMTGYLDKDSEVRNWPKYAETMLEKPFHKDAIVKAIDRAISEASPLTLLDEESLWRQSL